MNFQNIPRDDKVVKQAIIPRDGNVLHFLDYKQIEPRLLAYFAAKKGDTGMADRMRDGIDPYTAILFDRYGADMTPEQRDAGKRLFLSLMYGGGVGTVRVQFNLVCPASDEAGEQVRGCRCAACKAARKIINDFHEALPVVRRLQDGVVATANRRGYIRTPWGRHLHMEQWGEHKLLNKLIQGSAAHLMKRALIEVDNAITQEGLRTLPLSVVHDEIVLDGPHGEAKRVHELLPELMTTRACGNTDICEVVPIQVDHEVAVTSMADKRDFDEYVAIPY